MSKASTDPRPGVLRTPEARFADIADYPWEPHYLWGDHCPHTYLTMGEDLRANIPGAQHPGIDHRVYEASHFIQEDRGESVAADIVAFIDQHPA